MLLHCFEIKKGNTKDLKHHTESKVNYLCESAILSNDSSLEVETKPPIRGLGREKCNPVLKILRNNREISNKKDRFCFLNFNHVGWKLNTIYE